MDENLKTGPDESVMPNVSPQPLAEADTTGAPASSAVNIPSTPPPASAWLPPSAPQQGSDGASNSDGVAAQSGGLSVPAPAVADDGDVIEKEWVEKAKQIVARTRNDPYNQTRELHKFKAEYMQKRYNKTIEAVEE